jgi:RsiW-degrading membrane proteinase PrsW (M82 family)
MAPGGHLVLRASLSLLPVVLFLSALVWLDSFRLVRKRRVLVAIGVGAAGALLSFVINSFILELSGLSTMTFAIVAAPLVEEIIKGAWVTWQIRQRQVGFLVDAAIVGFATGAGFALVENLYYLQILPDAPLLVWIIRGIGTALMHGGTTAILAVYLVGRGARDLSAPPWLAAVGLTATLHASFNRFMTEPLLATAALVVVLPGLMVLVYRRGERRLRGWLGRGFDRDGELLALIIGGEVQSTPLGRYLVSLRAHMRPDTIADMLCLLRLQAELSLRAKGTLILREHGLRPADDPELPGKLAELRWLERSIGRTGRLAMRPVCHWQGSDRWQQHLLEEGTGDPPPR